ncbi:SHUGOSHIN 2 [Impatiens glandulifera]|uniref:SHUGOSHIN 2 n=1 Tax=Impatiens glandulifera TaxID=253017 RepID=UPI001FB1758C|nr:SHUGOSHIN 2 [Impatiens glandulifera]XP_047323941.1 SHUGOSHIN 2 [Impatiens glandulifera]
MKNGDGHTKKVSLGSMVRKRLSDITNSKSPVPDLKLSSTDVCSDKDHIEKLLKENLALTKIIEEKNKIIELSGNVLRKLKENLQKIQMQNWNLALTNSNMLAELNLGKDKLKTLNHEIACKNAVIKTKNLEIKEMVKTNKTLKSRSYQHVEEETIVVNKCDEKEDRVKSLKLVGRPTRRRSQSMGSLLAKEIMEIPENKRRCLKRRSSARFKSREQGEELKEEDEDEEEEGPNVNNCPMYEEKEKDDSSLMISNERKNDEKEEDDSSLMVSSERKNDGGGSDRRRRSSSMGIRPLRKATEKVHSYREIPINIKMRR